MWGFSAYWAGKVATLRLYKWSRLAAEASPSRFPKSSVRFSDENSQRNKNDQDNQIHHYLIKGYQKGLSGILEMFLFHTVQYSSSQLQEAVGHW